MGHGCHTCGSPNSCECVRVKMRDKTVVTATRDDDDIAAEVSVLLELVRKLQPPTSKDRQRQAFSFTYHGLISNGVVPNREMFKLIAHERYSWTYSEFKEWAKDKTWT